MSSARALDVWHVDGVDDWTDLDAAYIEIFGEHPAGVSTPLATVRAMPRQRIVHKPLERPDVEVLVDGTWCPGEVRMSTQLDDGRWEFNVQWRPPGTDTRRLDTFGEGDVRTEQVERTRSVDP
jgi:hypothetical protein